MSSTEEDKVIETEQGEVEQAPAKKHESDAKAENESPEETQQSGEPVKEPEEATSSDKTKEDEQVTGSEVKNEDPEPKGEQSSEKARVTGAEASAEQEYQKPKFNRFRTSKIDESIDLLMGTVKGSVAALKPITVSEYFRNAVGQWSSNIALKVKRGGQWVQYNYKQYWDNVMKTSKAFLKIGLERKQGVAIIGFNSPEWFFSSLGAVFAGGLSVGIYPTNSAEACQYILDSCKANICIVENQKQLDKILQIWERLPQLKAVVQYTGKLSQRIDNLYEWEEFLKLGEGMGDQVIEDIIQTQQPEDCAILIYTSGTTGPPKGVMISHDNMTWTARAVYHTYPESFLNPEVSHSLVSYLPLSHIAALILDIFLLMGIGGCTWFAQPDALKGSLVVTLKEAQPSVFFGVPRVWEKMMERMRDIGSTITGYKRKLADWGKRKALEGNLNKQKGEPVPWGWTLANLLVCRKVHEGLGLSNSKLFFVASAPISREVLEYFMSVNIPIHEVYGMSENTGPHVMTRPKPGYWKTASIGKCMEGVEVKIDNPDEHGDGEILMRGRNVFMGYLSMEDKTADTIDSDRWLHSGDIGRVDDDGFYYVTGRIKELIITAGGENVAPVPIENTIKAEVPFLSNIMLIGDRRKYLTCLATLKCAVDPDTGAPTDDLLADAKKALASIGCKFTKVSEVVAAKDENVDKAIMDGIKKYNEKAVSNAQKVQKYLLLNTDFSIPGGELGPTLKLKRHAVVQKYAKEIDSLYEE